MKCQSCGRKLDGPAHLIVRGKEREFICPECLKWAISASNGEDNPVPKTEEDQSFIEPETPGEVYLASMIDIAFGGKAL